MSCLHKEVDLSCLGQTDFICRVGKERKYLGIQDDELTKAVPLSTYNLVVIVTMSATNIMSHYGAVPGEGSKGFYA